MTKACPVTDTENLSHVRQADYPIRHSVSHIRHEGMPPFSQGEWGAVRMTQHIYRMSYIFLAAAREQICAQIMGYTFSFSRSGITKIGIMGDFLRAIVPGLSPFLCVRAVRRYGQNMTMTTVYIKQLFIYQN